MSSKEIDAAISSYNASLLSILKMASDHFAKNKLIQDQILRARDRAIIVKNTSYDLLVSLSGKIVIKYKDMIIGRDLSSFTEEKLNQEIEALKSNQLAALGKDYSKSDTILRFFGFAKQLYDDVGDEEKSMLFDKLDILLESAITYALLSGN